MIRLDESIRESTHFVSIGQPSLHLLHSQIIYEINHIRPAGDK